MTGRQREGQRLMAAILLAVLLGTGLPALAAAQASAPAALPVATPALSLEQQEAFLKKAKIIRTRSAAKGVTGTVRATLSDGTVTHDASIQTIDQQMREFRSNKGTELNFVDSWRYNVAAYQIDRLLGLNMTPPSVERRYEGKPGAFTWWVDEVLMDEGQRLQDQKSAPDAMAWNQQMWHVRVFDQLIGNVDRNLGNLLIDTRWGVWMIDHSRAFRLADKVRSPESLTRIDRQVLARLRTLDQAMVKKAVGNYLTNPEIRAMLTRRTEIVDRFDKLGSGAVFDWPRLAVSR